MQNEGSIRANLFKRKMKEGKIQIGCAVSLNHAPEMIRAGAAIGFDFFWFDMEHGQLGIETASELSRIAVETHVTPLIRICKDNIGLATQILDWGAQGIIFSKIESYQEAKEAVCSVKYPPQGKRGADMKPFHRKYRTMDAERFLKEMNEQTLVAIQIETIEGVKNIESIASVEGIDLIMIGPFDLSVSMGKPGQYHTPAFEREVSTIIKIGKKHGIACGMLGSLELAKRFIPRGMLVASCDSIIGIFMKGAENLVKEFSNAFANLR